MQFYTSNFLNGSLVGISGHTYRQTQAYTFETQHVPPTVDRRNLETDLPPARRDWSAGGLRRVAG